MLEKDRITCLNDYILVALTCIVIKCFKKTHPVLPQINPFWTLYNSPKELIAL